MKTPFFDVKLQKSDRDGKVARHKRGKGALDEN
jgi:hypothetical protein